MGAEAPCLPDRNAACLQDEGHKIKNPKMQARQGCGATLQEWNAVGPPLTPGAAEPTLLQLRVHLDAIPAAMRVIISGTPIQV